MLRLRSVTVNWLVGRLVNLVISVVTSFEDTPKTICLWQPALEMSTLKMNWLPFKAFHYEKGRTWRAELGIISIISGLCHKHEGHKHEGHTSNSAKESKWWKNKPGPITHPECPVFSNQIRWMLLMWGGPWFLNSISLIKRSKYWFYSCLF